MSQKARLPIIVAALTLVVIGVLYYLYVRDKSAYVDGRNLRLLSSAVAQLNQALESDRTLVKNFAKADSWCEEREAKDFKRPAKPILSYDRNLRVKHWLDNFLGDIDHIER